MEAESLQKSWRKFVLVSNKLKFCPAQPAELHNVPKVWNDWMAV